MPISFHFDLTSIIHFRWKVPARHVGSDEASFLLPICRWKVQGIVELEPSWEMEKVHNRGGDKCRDVTRCDKMWQVSTPVLYLTLQDHLTFHDLERPMQIHLLDLSKCLDNGDNDCLLNVNQISLSTTISLFVNEKHPTRLSMCLCSNKVDFEGDLRRNQSRQPSPWGFRHRMSLSVLFA